MKNLKESELTSLKMTTVRNSHNASSNTEAIGHQTTTRAGDSSVTRNSRKVAQDGLFPEIAESMNDVSTLY